MSKTRGKGMQVFLHIAAWSILLGFPLYGMLRWDIPREFLVAVFVNMVINFVLFYGNYLLLIPRYFMKGRKLSYYLYAFLLVVVLFFASMGLSQLIFTGEPEDGQHDRFRRESTERREQPPPPAERRRAIRLPFGLGHIYNFTFNAVAFTVLALGLRVIERHSDIEKRQKELEKEKLSSELAFLKNQISPHFFFNTLNNIYSLISINTDDSKDAVLKLSKMMRYLLYESERGHTKLSDEIDFMNNYIDLMRLRITDKVKLNVSFPADYSNISIPPLLFISVIENAFKHGISYREKSFIDVAMEVSAKMITFNCVNSLFPGGETKSKENSGIGLENLQKRLKLLFPGQHTFAIDKTESVYQVVIQIFMTNNPSDDQYNSH
ncbi:MAG: histidine kinase [Bacteroidales bacterium]|nr:histidine kinase [Bacteroidales bacterium]